MAEQTVLIVEDEEKIADLLRDYLRQEGFATHWIARGDEVADWVRNKSPDLVLLDIMLPGRDGLAVIAELRAFTNVPVILVTARIEEIDRVLGLELGADDYVCKPSVDERWLHGSKPFCGDCWPRPRSLMAVTEESPSIVNGSK